jgi:hypothetical protein
MTTDDTRPLTADEEMDALEAIVHPEGRCAATYIDRHEWFTSTPVLTHCVHGVDLRFTPRCYLCKPWPDDSPVLHVECEKRHAALVAAARDVLDVVSDDALSADALDALRAALEGEPR